MSGSTLASLLNYNILLQTSKLVHKRLRVLIFIALRLKRKDLVKQDHYSSQEMVAMEKKKNDPNYCVPVWPNWMDGKCSSP